MEEKNKQIANGNLYALLSVCSKEELDPLVTFITQKLSGTLILNDDYREYSPDHTKYYRAIGDEIRRFGGNTLRNLTRGGEGPPYSEVVIDVCKKLDIPCKAGRTVENESNLLEIYIERQWSALSEEDRDSIMRKARMEASSVTDVNIKNIMREGTSSFISGPSSVVMKITDPAFSVTVPCVIHIAFIRQKYLASINSASEQKEEVDVKPVGDSLSRSGTLIVMTSEESPVLSLARIPEPSVTEWNPVSSVNGIGRLNPLLQAVPSLATAGEVTSGIYMEVMINGPLLKAKGQDGFRLITMIDGKPSHGTLLDPSRLSSIANASALLQVASVAVAQKHLADISRKLSEIKVSVDKISRFQKNKRCSVIKGSIRYFEQVAQAVLSGERHASVRNEIEGHEAQLLQIQEHLRDDICEESESVLNLRDENLFGSQGMKDAISEHQKLLGSLFHQLLLCIRARACGLQLLAAYPDEEKLTEGRKQSIKMALSELSKEGDLLSNTDIYMRQKVKSLSAVWNKNVTLNERKLSLLDWNRSLVEEVSQAREQIMEDLRTVEVAIANQPQHVTMLVKIENEKIVATCSK